MDDITMRSACELVDTCRNKKLVVAYGVAEKTVEGDSITGHHRGIEYYAIVCVDRVVNGWADLKLEIPGPNGEDFFQDVVHTWISWPKARIRITQQPPSLQLTRLHHQPPCLNAKINYRIHPLQGQSAA
jgi:hypothetical protein